MMNRSAMRQRGFTLVEAVMVIVIMGVLGGMVAVFIRAPIQGYADSVGRAELSDVADLALRRMARDLRLALPNSIRVTPDGDAIEFLMTRSGGRYLAAEDGIDETRPHLDFIDPGETSLTVVGAMPRLTVGSDYFVVNNLGTGFTPANAWELGNMALIIGSDAASNRLELFDNPFAAQIPPSPSPDSRFHIVSSAVTYACGQEAGAMTRTLTRQAGYAITANQVTYPPDGTRSVLAGRVRSCNFHYETLASRRSGLVILSLELLPRNRSDGAIRLVHQVHVDNAP